MTMKFFTVNTHPTGKLSVTNTYNSSTNLEHNETEAMFNEGVTFV